MENKLSYVSACPFNFSNDLGERVLWEITFKCNLRCRHCLYYVDEKRFSDDLTLCQIKTIVDSMKKSNVKYIWLSGGEPLIRLDIFDIIEYITQKDIVASLSTNGTLIDSEDYANRLKKAGISYVHISLDGVSPGVHDKLRGVVGSYEKTVRAISYLVNARIKVGISFMVTETSINEVCEMIFFAKSIGVSILSFYLVAPIGRGKKIDYNDHIQLALRLKDIVDKADDKTGLKIETIRIPQKGSLLDYCSAEKFITITNSGQLSSCPWLEKKEVIEKASLLEMDFCEAEKLIIERTKDYISNWHNSICKKCIKERDCGKGCPAVCLKGQSDPLCTCINKA